MSAKSSLSVGNRAPDFSLTDQKGDPWKLSDYRGRVVVLLFYPGDETPVCTKQMCSLRDRWEDYHATGAEVVGISANSDESHQSFTANHRLPLTLLSDPDHAVARLYSAMSLIPGKMGRAVIVIGPDGRVSYKKVKSLFGMIIPPSDDETIKAIRVAQLSTAAEA
jgi:peroxiredoxin Q/BCP